MKYEEKVKKERMVEEIEAKIAPVSSFNYSFNSDVDELIEMFRLSSGMRRDAKPRTIVHKAIKDFYFLSGIGDSTISPTKNGCVVSFRAAINQGASTKPIIIETMNEIHASSFFCGNQEAGDFDYSIKFVGISLDILNESTKNMLIYVSPLAYDEKSIEAKISIATYIKEITVRVNRLRKL